MNGMMGMTQLLLGTALNEKQERFAQTVNRSAESLLEIINDILDFSKIEAGRLELEHVEFDVSDLVDESVELFLGGRLRQRYRAHVLDTTRQDRRGNR